MKPLTWITLPSMRSISSRRPGRPVSSRSSSVTSIRSFEAKPRTSSRPMLETVTEPVVGSGVGPLDRLEPRRDAAILARPLERGPARIVASQVDLDAVELVLEPAVAAVRAARCIRWSRAGPALLARAAGRGRAGRLGAETRFQIGAVRARRQLERPSPARRSACAWRCRALRARPRAGSRARARSGAAPATST